MHYISEYVETTITSISIQRRRATQAFRTLSCVPEIEIDEVPTVGCSASSPPAPRAIIGALPRAEFFRCTGANPLFSRVCEPRWRGDPSDFASIRTLPAAFSTRVERRCCGARRPLCERPRRTPKSPSKNFRKKSAEGPPPDPKFVRSGDWRESTIPAPSSATLCNVASDTRSVRKGWR